MNYDRKKIHGEKKKSKHVKYIKKINKSKSNHNYCKVSKVEVKFFNRSVAINIIWHIKLTNTQILQQ